MYDSNNVEMGKVIACVSPCQQQGTSVACALLSSFASKSDKKVILFSNEMRYDLNATSLLKPEKVSDGLADIITFASSKLVEDVDDIIVYSTSISDNFDIVGCSSKEKAMTANFGKVASNIFNLLKESYDYIFVDVSQDSMDQDLLNESDLILYGLPQSIDFFKMFSDKISPIYNQILENKDYILVSNKYIEFSHVSLGKLEKIVDEDVYHIAMDEQLNKVVLEKNIYSYISNIFSNPKLKKKSTVFKDLERIYSVITKI